MRRVRIGARVVPCHDTLTRNQRRYYTNAVNEPTNTANQTLACRRTIMVNRDTPGPGIVTFARCKIELFAPCVIERWEIRGINRFLVKCSVIWAALIKNQRRYFTNAVNEPTDKANQMLACRHTSQDTL